MLLSLGFKPSKMKDKIRALLMHEAQAIENIPVTEDFEQAIALIYKCVHENKGKLIVSGMGKAGQIAVNIATTFSSTGTPAVFLHPSDAQHGDIGVICPGDVVLLISNSGKTREILELVSLCEQLHPDLFYIVITGNPESPLGEIAHITLSTGNPKEICPLGMAPTTSTTVMTALGDVLVVLMMEKIGFTVEDYAKRHHGGYLGIRSREAAKKVNKAF